MVAIEMMKSWWAYLAYCFLSDFSNLACKPYWTWVAIGCLVLASIIIFFVGRSILREYLEFRRNRKHLEARAVIAPREVIEAASWKGDALAGDPEQLSTEELAIQFRQALSKHNRQPLLTK